MATKAVAPKVYSSTVFAYLGSAGLLAILQAVNDNHALLGGLPPQVAAFVYAFLPALLTFVAGYVAKHQPRTVDGEVIESSVGQPRQVGPKANQDEYVTDIDTSEDAE